MFLYQSNRLENLCTQWRAVIATPLADPMAPEIVVVHNQGMAQWLARQTAFAEGIAANLQFPLPGRFIWDLMHRLTDSPPEEDLFAKPVLLWRISRLLPEGTGHPLFAEIGAYLCDDADGRKRYQLAGRIADLFDQYMVYRPDLLARWQQPRPDEDWQAVLWRRLTEDGPPLRARMAERFREILDGESGEDLDLPERIHLFGINALAPLYLDILTRLGRRTEVHLFHLSPCRQYWSELVSARRLAGLRRQGPDADDAVDDYFDQGNPLLASLGRTGQDFCRQLLEGDPVEFDLHQNTDRPGLLAALQNDILDLHDRTGHDLSRAVLDPDDCSLQLHACFSRLREIQVLHDRLLDLFQALPDLTPAEVLVTAPDIQSYAAAIAGVFGEAAPERRIPWSIADQNARQELPVVRCFLDLMALLGSRFTAPEVLALCEHEPLLTRFGLDAAFLPRLHEWVRDAGIRWGLDQEHRNQMAVQAGEQHSWRFGLDRLLLGHLMGNCEAPFQGRLPFPDLTGGEANELGAFLDLIDTLARWHDRFQGCRPAADWQGLLLSMLVDCFDAGAEEEGLCVLRETVQALAASCAAAGFADEIPAEVIRLHLESALSGMEGGQPFQNGRVTFCNMVPMRSVPFRVIWLLGMNDTDFPRSQHPAAFDLMARHPRLGDRNRRNDDRYLFLEALLSAREVLAISWVGRSLRDEAVSPPSVVVSELQDYLNAGWMAPTGTVSGQLTTLHPMQPFSRRCFDGSAATSSYNPSWLPAAMEQEPPPFLAAPLPPPDPAGTLDLGQLVRFWNHPVRSFLEQTLGLRTREEGYDQADSEPFVLDHLEQHQLRRETIAGLLAGTGSTQLFAAFSGSGRLPQAGFAQVLFEELAATSAAYTDRLRPLLAAPLPPLDVDLTIDGLHLTGQLTDLHAAGRVAWSSGKLKAGQLMALWIHHLVLTLMAPEGLPPKSILVTWGDGKEEAVAKYHLGPVSDATAHLRELLAGYHLGQTRPLPFFPRTSLAWARAVPDKAMDQARKVWYGGYKSDGEGAEPECLLCFAQTDPLDAEFISLAALLRTVLELTEASHAAA